MDQKWPSAQEFETPVVECTLHYIRTVYVCVFFSCIFDACCPFYPVYVTSQRAVHTHHSNRRGQLVSSGPICHSGRQAGRLPRLWLGGLVSAWGQSISLHALPSNCQICTGIYANWQARAASGSATFCAKTINNGKRRQASISQGYCTLVLITATENPHWIIHSSVIYTGIINTSL